jgi:acetyl-CoA synthase
MSKIIAQAAIRGAHKLVAQAEEDWKRAVDEHGPNKEVEFPNTGYYLPIIYSITGIPVKTIGDMEQVLNKAKQLLPPVPADSLWLPYLGNTLDAGMATLFAEEIIEALKYLQDPIPYHIATAPEDGKLWLGAADDKIMRERGIEFVDGTAPGFAACVGSLPDSKTAVKIARQLQEKSLYVFMHANYNGTSMAEQLQQENIQMGWETRLIPFGREITSAVFALGFASRAAMSFGGVEPGDYRRILMYNRHRVFAFVLAFGEVTDEWYATAAGAINYGFPTIADTPIPSIYPRGICLYEHVVPNIPHDEIVDKAIEVRGLKVVTTKIDIPVSYAPAFEGERIRKEDVHVEACHARTKKTSFEFLTSIPTSQIEDGKIELIGKDIDEIEPGTGVSLGFVIEVGGARMQKDFEPVLERQLHAFINHAKGLWHAGQRDANWIRISKEAFDAGFRLKDFGKIFYAKFMSEYSSIIDKMQIKIITDEEELEKYHKIAKESYKARDERIAGLEDEAVEEFYSCTLCQSFAPDHVCIITPERPGLCGAITWLDGKASFEINPHGPNQPIKKGVCLDEKKGQWQGVNEAVVKHSHGKLERFNAYSIMEDPMTSCGCFECISCILPMTNGIMTVDRESAMMTPCGMKFSTLAGSVGGGLQTPGFVGHSKLYMGSKKFISAEGGILRLTWMPKSLKEELGDIINLRAKEKGVENFIEMVADETFATTEEEVLAHLEKVQHPVLTMDPMV